MIKLNNVNFNSFDKNHKLRLFAMKSFRFLPDEAYLKFVYKMRTGRTLNLDDPKDYCEKLNWLKLKNKNDEYTKCVDKIAVKEIVSRKIGKKYVIPTLGYWKHFEDIDWNSLPNEFVMKCNHDSGSFKFITDKESLGSSEKKQLKKHFNKHVAGNPFFAGREYPYKNVDAYIMAEPLLKEHDNTSIIDYKIMCFNGEPKLLWVITGRREDHREDFYDMEGNLIEMDAGYKHRDIPLKEIPCFDEAIKIAKNLSQGMPHVRIDLMCHNGKLYFGEYTFFTHGGFLNFNPPEVERKLGDYIELNSLKDNC